MEGIYVYLLLIHTVVQQKSKQHCKAIILQLKIKKKEFCVDMLSVRCLVDKWSG